MIEDKRIVGNEIAGSADVSSAEGPQEPKGWYSRGYLPHFDVPEILQFVTFRLHDSVPEEKIQAWKDELKSLPKKERENKLRSQILKYVDLGAGECILRDTRIAKIVEDSLLFFDRERYNLSNWVVMPNHVHVLMELTGTQSIAEIVKSWKSYTCHEINKILHRNGTIWYREYYDRYIRDDEHWSNVVSYIEANPVKAKLCVYPEDWRWSSSWRRKHGDD